MAGTISRGRGGVSRALNLCTLMTLLSCASIVAACDHDAPTGLTAVETPPSRVVEIASPANSAYDNGINRNDTWMEQTQTIAETTTVTSSEPFDDPNTGQQTYTTTLGSEPQTVNVSAGYGYDGQPRFTTGFQQTSGEETIWMQRVTDVTTDRRADGSDTQPIAYDPMNELGSLYGARLEYGSGAGSGAAVAAASSATTSRRESGRPPRTNRGLFGSRTSFPIWRRRSPARSSARKDRTVSNRTNRMRWRGWWGMG